MSKYKHVFSIVLCVVLFTVVIVNIFYKKDNKTENDINIVDESIADESIVVLDTSLDCDENSDDYYSMHRVMDADEFRRIQVGRIDETLKIHAFGTPDYGNEMHIKLNDVSYDENGNCHIEIYVDVLANEDILVTSFQQQFLLMYLNSDLNIPDSNYNACVPYIENEEDIRFAKIIIPNGEQSMDSLVYEETDSKQDAIILNPGQNLLKFKYITSQYNYQLEGRRWCLTNLKMPEVTCVKNKYGNITYVYEIE